MTDKVTIPKLHQMKRDREKIFGVVVWDTQLAQIVDRVGVDIVSVGDTVGINLWGHENPLEVTMDEMVIVARAVRRGVTRALVSVDFPFGPLQSGTAAAVAAAIRLVKEAGVDMVKLDGAANFPEAVMAIAEAGIPVWAQFGMTPQTALHYGVEYAAQNTPGAEVPPAMQERLIAEAKALEQAGAALLDFTNSGPIVGPEVVAATEIPVVGVLRGLLAGETDQTSRAIISNGDDEKTYSVGDTIAAGITVHAILADRVIISRRGTLESVRLPRESGILGNNTSSVASGYSAVPLGTGSEIAASIINAVATLTEIVRPIPVSRNGKQIGFRVYPGRARKKFVELGLQAGDIVTAINNISLDDPAMGVQAFENLGNQSSITLSLIRDGQEQQLVLQTGR